MKTMSVLKALLRILQEVTFAPNLGSFLPLQLKVRIQIKDANKIAIIEHMTSHKRSRILKYIPSEAAPFSVSPKQNDSRFSPINDGVLDPTEDPVENSVDVLAVLLLSSSIITSSPTSSSR